MGQLILFDGALHLDRQASGGCPDSGDEALEAGKTGLQQSLERCEASQRTSYGTGKLASQLTETGPTPWAVVCSQNHEK